MSTRKTPPPYIVLPQGEPLQRALWRLGYEAAWDDLKERCYCMYIRGEVGAFMSRMAAWEAMIEVERVRMEAQAMAFNLRVKAYNKRVADMMLHDDIANNIEFNESVEDYNRRIAEALPDIADRAG